MTLEIDSASSATPKKLFWMARRINIWLKSIMTLSCSCSLAILHCHKKGTHNLDLEVIGNEFVSKHDTENWSLEGFQEII